MGRKAMPWWGWLLVLLAPPLVLIGVVVLPLALLTALMVQLTCFIVGWDTPDWVDDMTT